MMFVSYSRSDLVATQWIVESLMKAGVECWFDDTNIPMGQAFVEQLGVALHKANCFLLLDTSASRSSYWVHRELQVSSRYRRQGKYHSVLRLYSPNCKIMDATNWDVSLPFDEQSPDKVAKYLNERCTDQHLTIAGYEAVKFSILNNVGLGQPSNWNGRHNELHLLDEWWLGPSPAVWLRGFGGSGKSGLLQTWITALSSFGYDEAVSASILYFAGSQISLPTARHEMRAWKWRKSTACRLFILDGHDEAHNLQDTELALSEAINLGARVIVTSRSAVPQKLASSFTVLSLDSLTRRDCIAILDQFGIAGSISEELADESGYHPLALLLLSRLFVNQNRTASEILRELRHVRRDISRGGFYTPRSIKHTVNSSLQSLTSEARSLLESLCKSEQASVGGDELANPAIRELANAGLVQVDHLETPTQISIHPIVRSSINES